LATNNNKRKAPTANILINVFEFIVTPFVLAVMFGTFSIVSRVWFIALLVAVALVN
jgi:hypothetical protein